MTTALIADDEPHLAQALATRLRELWPELQVVAIARDGTEAADRIAALEPDLAFLDIQMPGLTGLEVAQGIEGLTRVVFVTAYDEYAVAAFERAAFDYLLKPVKTERLQRTLERLRGTLAPDAEDDRLAAALDAMRPPATAPAPRLRWIRASSGNATHQIPVRDVLFFRSEDKYTCARTADAEHLLRTPLFELCAQLDPELFVQVHRSTIVNLEHLEGTRRDDASRLFLRMRGHPQELPVSRAYVHLFRAM